MWWTPWILPRSLGLVHADAAKAMAGSMHRTNSQQVVSEPMDDLWADSPENINSCGLAQRLSEEQEKSIATGAFNRARKFLVRAARWLSVEWVLSMKHEKFLVRAALG